MKEKLNKKEQHKLYTLFTIYRSNIVGKQINSSTIAYLFLPPILPISVVMAKD